MIEDFALFFTLTGSLVLAAVGYATLAFSDSEPHEDFGDFDAMPSIAPTDTYCRAMVWFGLSGVPFLLHPLMV